MKNGQTPIHIQRWAPADFHADETVKLLKARRDYLTLSFYRTFLDESFMAGGDLPADEESLAAILIMPKSHVRKALAVILGVLVFEENGRLFQPRIRRDVADELEFREIQRQNGKKGGRKASLSQALPNAMGQPKDSQSPPAPFAFRLSPAPMANPETPAELSAPPVEKALTPQQRFVKDALEVYAGVGAPPPAASLLCRWCKEFMKGNYDWTLRELNRLALAGHLSSGVPYVSKALKNIGAGVGLPAMPKPPDDREWKPMEELT